MREFLQQDGCDFEVIYLEGGGEKHEFVGVDEAQRLRKLANIQSVNTLPN